jgi:EcsC family protein
VSDATDEPGALPDGLWERLRADPVRAPEHLALAAAQRHGATAAAWAAERQSRYAVGGRDLALMAKKRHASLARLGGAATGVGGFVTFLPDLVSLAWIQSRLVFFVAAAYGFDPRDPMRPAELLVLRDLYPDPPSARRALDGLGRTVAEAYIGSKLERDEALAKRLAFMVGKRGVRRVAGRLVPGFAIMVNAVGNERDTRRLADRCITFYGG